MVVKKDAEKEKKTVKIKATTGAWWKSTTPSDVAPAPSKAAESKKSPVAAAKPKAAPKKRPVKKTTVKVSTKQEGAEAGQESREEPQKSAPARKPAGRRPARKKKETSEKKTPSKTASVEQLEAVPQTDTSVSQIAESPAEEQVVPKRPRGRRGRGTGKKPVVVEEISTTEEKPEADAGVVAGAAGIEDAGPERVSASSSPGEPDEPAAVSEPQPGKEKSARAATPQKEQLEDVSQTDTAVSQVEAPPAEEKVAPKRPRGRRGRGTAKKPVVVEETSTIAENPESDAGVVAGVAGIEDAEREKVSTSSSPGEPGEQAAVSEPQPGKEKTARAATPRIEEVKKVTKLLINAEEPEECRLALLEDGRLESIHVSTISRTQTKSNIYKARIVAIEPSLQAAFVDYGTEKNGFLPFSEIHPEYYKQELSAEIRQQVENNQWKKINITDVVERGQEILAQVVKEEVGKKGANMTTFLSIPGRCVVLMPGSDSAGISRKISGEKRRSQLRETMTSMDLPEGIGWIVRTASVDITQEALSRDVEYLLELWGEIKNKGQEMDGVGLVYEDHRSVLRFLREHFDPSIQEILVDDRTALEQVKEFVKMLPAQQRTVNVRFHQGARPIFNQYSVEDQIESIYQPQVSLPSGGSIVIDPTEALVAIDVNSGSTSKGKNFEASIFQANMEAAKELARQLRLRDLGGLIVVDFIDMRNKKHILTVEREVKAAMKKDKAKVDFSRISKFGLMQISRQKLGAPIEAGNYRRCEHCKGRGTVRSVETLSLYYLRRIQTGASRKPVEAIECHFPLDVASYLLNNKRSELSELENRYQVEISIVAEVDMKPADNELLFHKAEKDTNSKKQA